MFVRSEAPSPYPSFGSIGLSASPAPSFGSLGSTPQPRDFPRGLGSADNRQHASEPGHARAVPCGPGVGVSEQRVSVWSEDAASDPVVLQLTHLSFLLVGRAVTDLFLHPRPGDCSVGAPTP